MLQFSSSHLNQVVQAIFCAAGAKTQDAIQIADILVANHLAGHDSHGILRIPEYLQSILDGEIVPSANPEIIQETPTSGVVKGNWAFGQIAANFATDLAIEKALDMGVCAVSVVQAAHTGRLAVFTERAAAKGVVMFMTIGTVDRPMTAPYGGAAPLLGTNPIAITLPNLEGPHVTLDFATSAIAAGKIKVAKAKHEALPPNCLVDKHGNPSTDPNDFFDGGFMLPFGGHKGYALAVMAELMSGPLVGSESFPGITQRSGIFIFAMKASLFQPMDNYNQALQKSLKKIKSIPPAKGFSEVLLPGEPESNMHKKRQQQGIPIPEDTWAAVKNAGITVGVDIDAIKAK
ncbi:MAG: Ldh family oxidoreductase [Betaproteobacteria bacterium]|jgi:LDH2 family malate/lactate/ureidoglycolate dehydrogenase